MCVIWTNWMSQYCCLLFVTWLKKIPKEETFFCFTLTLRIKAEFPHNGKNIPSKSFFRVDIVDTGHKTTFNMCSMFLVFIQILLLSAGTFSSITQKGRDGYLLQGFQAGWLHCASVVWWIGLKLVADNKALQWNKVACPICKTLLLTPLCS